MSSPDATADYIHGFGEVEADRLWAQAELLGRHVFEHLPLPDRGRLVELGCGVGAELDQIRRRRSDLELIGVELSASHLDAARTRAAHLAHLVHADATRLPLADASVDAAITIWVLEHVGDPVAVMREALRVLRPDGVLVCTEVDNATFRFDPPLPAVEAWWRRFCDTQVAAGGDPFIGRRLHSIAHDLGARDVATRDVAIVASPDDPVRQAELIDYVDDLLSSGARTMAEHEVVSDEDLDALRRDLDLARAEPDLRWEYHAVQLTCRPPSS